MSPVSAPSLRKFPLILALVVSMAVVVAMENPENEKWKSPGGKRDMHKSHRCDLCHLPAEGTVRQQVQANLQHWLGLRSSGADLVTKKIDNSDCLDCHRNLDDPHAVHLFLEPRFEDARAALQPQHCNGCHSHHSGKISTREMGICKHCHQDLEISNDRTTPSHLELVKEERWDSCLRCHDYHGNHLGEVPDHLDDAHDPLSIQDYLSGNSPSPYGEIKIPYLEERGIPR